MVLNLGIFADATFPFLLAAASVARTVAVPGPAWLQLLLLEAAALTVAFLLHRPTEWMVLDVAPALIVTVAIGFAAARARRAVLRLRFAALTALCLLWIGTIVWPVARDLGYLPSAVEVEGVLATGAGRGRGYGWRGREGLTEYECSMTIFGLSPNTSAKWSANGAEAVRQAATARVPRWWSEIGQFSSWAPLPNATEGLPPQLRGMYSRSDSGGCGVRGEDRIQDAWRSRYTLLGELPDAAILLVLDPRDPYAVLIRYREHSVRSAAPANPVNREPGLHIPETRRSS